MLDSLTINLQSKQHLTNRKINRSKSFIKNLQELKNNIMVSYCKSKEDGSKKEENGKKREIKREENFNNCKKK